MILIVDCWNEPGLFLSTHGRRFPAIFRFTSPVGLPPKLGPAKTMIRKWKSPGKKWSLSTLYISSNIQNISWSQKSWNKSLLVGFACKRFLLSPPLPRHALFCARPDFRAAKKRKMPWTCGKPYGNACYAGYLFNGSSRYRRQQQQQQAYTAMWLTDASTIQPYDQCGRKRGYRHLFP